MTYKESRCIRCGRRILALRREQRPLCHRCKPVVQPKKQGLLALLFSAVVR